MGCSIQDLFETAKLDRHCLLRVQALIRQRPIAQRFLENFSANFLDSQAVSSPILWRFRNLLLENLLLIFQLRRLGKVKRNSLQTANITPVPEEVESFLLCRKNQELALPEISVWHRLTTLLPVPCEANSSFANFQVHHHTCKCRLGSMPSAWLRLTQRQPKIHLLPDCCAEHPSQELHILIKARHSRGGQATIRGKALSHMVMMAPSFPMDFHEEVHKHRKPIIPIFGHAEVGGNPWPRTRFGVSKLWSQADHSILAPPPYPLNVAEWGPLQVVPPQRGLNAQSQFPSRHPQALWKAWIGDGLLEELHRLHIEHRSLILGLSTFAWVSASFRHIMHLKLSLWYPKAFPKNWTAWRREAGVFFPLPSWTREKRYFQTVSLSRMALPKDFLSGHILPAHSKRFSNNLTYRNPVAALFGLANAANPATQSSWGTSIKMLVISISTPISSSST